MKLYKENKLNIITKYKKSLVTVTGLILSLLFLSLFASCGKKDEGLVAVYEDETVSGDESVSGAENMTGYESEDGTGNMSEEQSLTESNQTLAQANSGEASGRETTLVSDEVSLTADSSVMKEIRVYVCGAVKQPDVYEISSDSRIVDAVSAAGGFAIDAYPEALNLAANVGDGSRIYVPTKEEVLALSSSESGDGTISGEDVLTANILGEGYNSSFVTGTETRDDGSGATGGNLASGSDGSAKASGNGSGGTSDGSTGKVNINTASIEELTTLPGIGDTRARAIIDYREQNGAFGSIEDIMQVTGIKEKSFSKIRDSICVK